MIAVMHSIFNVFTTFILLPFTKQLEMIANKVYPEVEGEKEPEYDLVLDERLFAVPALAIKDSNDAAEASGTSGSELPAGNLTYPGPTY